MRAFLACVLLLAGPALAEPQRVVSAGGDLTEIAFALGAGERIIAVDQTSNWPPETGELPQIGYVRRLSAEGILSLAPDLMLAAHDAGPDIALEQLEAAGVEIARMPGGDDIDAIPEKIRAVGEALGRRDEADVLVERFEADLAETQAKIARIEGRPAVLFVLAIRNGAPLVAGTGTSADAMIRAAGAANVANGIEGYKPMSREAILAANPEILLMMEQHADREGGMGAMLALPEFRLTPAGRAERGVTMEGMLLLGFGPRTPEALAELARRLHGANADAAGL